MRPAPRQPRHHQPRAPGRGRLGVGLRRSPRSRARACRPQEIIEAIHDGTIKGLLSICFNPLVSAPDSTFTTEALDKLEFFSVIDFFLSETAQHADVVLPGSLHEEDEGTSTSGEGRHHQDQRGRHPAGRGPPRLGDPHRPRPSASGGASTSRSVDRGDLRGAAPRLGRAAPPTTAASPGNGSSDEMGLFWPVPEDGHPGTPRLFEGGQFFHPDGKARFHPIPFREVGRGRRRRLPDLAHHRPRRSASTCPAPRPDGSARSSPSTPSRSARCTPAWPSSSA